MTDKELIKAVQQMSTRDAVWLLTAPSGVMVWSTIDMPLMGWQMERNGLIEVWNGLARPTPLGRRAARIYCEMSGLEV